MNLEELNNNLVKIAFNKTIPFCYNCYIEAPTGRCKECYSDDLMRLLPGYGCEYGTCWVIEALIKENLQPLDTEEVFTEMLESCYPETTKVGFLDLNTVSVMKDQDPIAFNIAEGEYIDSLLQDEQIVTFDDGGNYYWLSDLVKYIEESGP